MLCKLDCQYVNTIDNWNLLMLNTVSHQINVDFNKKKIKLMRSIRQQCITAKVSLVHIITHQYLY